MEQIILILGNILSFIFVLIILVSIHEYGHYIVARKLGVQIDVFSIGIGKKLFKFIDKFGTEWCLSLLPIGGYVKMFGDRNIASEDDEEFIRNLTLEEKKKTFIYQPVLNRAMIVAAGPLFNYLFAFFIFLFLFWTSGTVNFPPIIDQIEPNSPAYRSNLKNGDKIIEINNQKISDFRDIKLYIHSSEGEIDVLYERNGEIISTKVMPEIHEMTDLAGHKRKTKIIGIKPIAPTTQKVGLLKSIDLSFQELYMGSKAVFSGIANLIMGHANSDDFGGIITIAEYSGATARLSFTSLLAFIATLSISLAAINLLPIPVLDGGHLLFYVCEGILRRPLSKNFQNIAYKIGGVVIIFLMVWVNLKDIIRIF